MEEIRESATEAATEATTEAATDEIEVLQALLDQQENEIITLRNSRESTIRKLHRAKLKITDPTEQILKFAANAGPMDDNFFNLLSRDAEVISEIISAIIGVRVKVKNPVPQYSILNLGSMGVRLDNFSECVLEAELLEDSAEFGKKGTLIDVEVQNEKDDLEFRAFYNGASMIISRTPPKTEYKDIPCGIVIFIKIRFCTRDLNIPLITYSMLQIEVILVFQN